MKESGPEVSPPRSLALPRTYRIPYLVSRTQTRTRLTFDSLATLAVSSTRPRTLLAKNHSDFAPPGNHRSDQFSGPRRVPVLPGARSHGGSPRNAQEPERVRLNISLSKRLFQAWGRSGNLPGRAAWHNRYRWQPQRRPPQDWAGPGDWARAPLARAPLARAPLARARLARARLARARLARAPLSCCGGASDPSWTTGRLQAPQRRARLPPRGRPEKRVASSSERARPGARGRSSSGSVRIRSPGRAISRGSPHG
jgi:hypothetical protein